MDEADEATAARLRDLGLDPGALVRLTAQCPSQTFC
jgi:Fe2+ transport system protein FeoA